MSSPSPAGPGSNPAASSAPVRPETVTFYALVGPADRPLTLGRTPGEAEARLYAVLLRFYSEEADPVSEEPVADARAELARWKKGALLAGTAADELSAFLAWALVTPLLADEALADWREVFPAPPGTDPLAELVSRGLLSEGDAPGAAVRDDRRRSRRARRRPRVR